MRSDWRRVNRAAAGRLQGILGILLTLTWAAPAAAQVHTITPGSLEELRALFHYREGSTPLLVAHRGARGYPGFPENSLEVFDHVLRHTHAIIETDFILTGDDQVVMMHDDTLDRTTTGSGRVADRTLEEIRSLRLVDGQGEVTDFHTRSFREVLDWAEGRTIVAVDVKAPLTFQRAIEEIVAAGAEARVFIQTYNLEDALRVHTLHPGLMMSTSIRTAADVAALQEAGIPLGNVIAHPGSREPEDPALYHLLRQEGMYTMVGTLGAMDREAAAGNPDVYRALLRNGATIISTDRPVEAAEAIQGMLPSGGGVKPPLGVSRRE